jgi:hypothetical protein
MVASIKLLTPARDVEGRTTCGRSKASAWYWLDKRPRMLSFHLAFDPR